jgi:hypothetical protein
MLWEFAFVDLNLDPVRFLKGRYNATITQFVHLLCNNFKFKLWRWYKIVFHLYEWTITNLSSKRSTGRFPFIYYNKLDYTAYYNVLNNMLDIWKTKLEKKKNTNSQNDMSWIGLHSHDSTFFCFFFFFFLRKKVFDNHIHVIVAVLK